MCKAAEEEGVEAEVMLCATPVYRTNWKTKDRVEYRSDVVRGKTVFWRFSSQLQWQMCLHCGEQIVISVCVWRACLVSLHWEATVGCITSDFLFQLAGLAFFSTLALLYTWAPSSVSLLLSTTDQNLHLYVYCSIVLYSLFFLCLPSADKWM